MGIVHENTNFRSSEIDFPGRKSPPGKEIRGYKSKTTPPKKTRSTDFSSAPNTGKTIKTCSHVSIAHFNRLIVNIATAVTLMGRH